MARTVNKAHATQLGFQLDDEWSNLPKDQTAGHGAKLERRAKITRSS
jgi:hypothetical protein